MSLVTVSATSTIAVRRLTSLFGLLFIQFSVCIHIHTLSPNYLLADSDPDLDPESVYSSDPQVYEEVRRLLLTSIGSSKVEFGSAFSNETRRYTNDIDTITTHQLIRAHIDDATSPRSMAAARPPPRRAMAATAAAAFSLKDSKLIANVSCGNATSDAKLERIMQSPRSSPAEASGLAELVPDEEFGDFPLDEDGAYIIQ